MSPSARIHARRECLSEAHDQAGDAGAPGAELRFDEKPRAAVGIEGDRVDGQRRHVTVLASALVDRELELLGPAPEGAVVERLHRPGRARRVFAHEIQRDRHRVVQGDLDGEAPCSKDIDQGHPRERPDVRRTNQIVNVQLCPPKVRLQVDGHLPLTSGD